MRKVKEIKIFENKAELIDYIVKPDTLVLDVGFWGQKVVVTDPNWVHRLLLNKTKAVYGLDIDYDQSIIATINNPGNYLRGNAEAFTFNTKFDLIVAADLIEHLPNPGLFLANCKNNLNEAGSLVLTTPNCFHFFNILSKIRYPEPPVNKDHTCYFNRTTITQLLAKCGWGVTDFSYIYSLGHRFNLGAEAKLLDMIHYFLSKLTPKFVTTMVIACKPLSN